VVAVAKQQAGSSACDAGGERERAPAAAAAGCRRGPRRPFIAGPLGATSAHGRARPTPATPAHQTPDTRAPAPTPPTCAALCADLAPTLPPTLPPTAANWRRTPWLALPCAVCADRRRPAPTGRLVPAASRRRTGCRVHHNAPPAVRGSPRRPYTHTTSDAEHFAEVLRSKKRYVQEDEPVRIDE
jgi:hypothetical protein